MDKIDFGQFDNMGQKRLILGQTKISDDSTDSQTLLTEVNCYVNTLGIFSLTAIPSITVPHKVDFS